MSPFFSIVVPVYNQIGKMELCIESLKSQTFGDFEVIFVDDASTDGSYEFLRRVEEEDTRFHTVRHKKNSSVLAARYTGMRRAKGKYLLFVDSDDSISANACQILYERIQKEPADILLFGAVMIPSMVTVAAQKEEPIRTCFNSIGLPSVWKNCYSRKVITKSLERFEPFYCNIGEDSYMCCVLFSCAETFARMEEILYYYIEGQGMSAAIENSLESTAQDLQYAETAGEHIMKYVREYIPQYSDLAERKTEDIVRFVLFRHVYFEEDWSNVFKYMELFNNEKHKKAFEYGCKKLFPAKVKHSMGMKVMETDLQ